MYLRILSCPKQGQGFKPSEAHLYPNIARVTPPPTGRGTYQKGFETDLDISPLKTSRNQVFPIWTFIQMALLYQGQQLKAIRSEHLQIQMRVLVTG